MFKIDPTNPVVRFLKDPWHLIAADVIPVLAATYFTVKKLTNFSAEGLLDGLIKPKGTDVLIGIGLAVIGYATVVKVALLVIGRFEIPLISGFDNGSLLHLFKKNNKEIEQHLADIKLTTFNQQSFGRFHTFGPNINLLVYSLNEHLLSVLPSSSGRVRQRDLCISFYEIVPAESQSARGQCFKLVANHPAQLEVKTVEMFTADPIFAGFAGVKALKGGVPICIPNCSAGEYVKAGVKRRKNVKQYFGVPMEVTGQRAGLLNIEIHNKICFASAKLMEDFYSEDLYPFKCLFEYQLLKREFFTQLASRITP